MSLARFIPDFGWRAWLKAVWIPAFAGMTGVEIGNDGVGKRDWRGWKSGMTGLEIGHGGVKSRHGGAAIVRFGIMSTRARRNPKRTKDER